MHATIGIDVGATTTSAGIVAADGPVITVVSAPTREHPRTNPVDALLKLVSGRVADAQARGMVLDGIGIGLPGLVDVAKGMMIDTVNFVPELGQVPIADLIRASGPTPVCGPRSIWRARCSTPIPRCCSPARPAPARSCSRG